MINVKEILRLFIGSWLDSVFGEHLKTTVEEKGEYYFVAVRISKSLANNMFSKVENIGQTILAGLQGKK